MTDAPAKSSAPSWVTSAGALFAIALAALSFAGRDGEQREAQRRTDIAEQRMQETQQRLWESQQASRAEFRDELRHEVQVACHCSEPRP